MPDTGDGALRIPISGPPPTTGPDGSFSVAEQARQDDPRRDDCTVAPALKPGLVVQAGQTLDIGTFVVNSPKPPPALIRWFVMTGHQRKLLLSAGGR